VDAARKRLWGTVLAGSRSSSFDTFDSLYRAVSDVLEYSYNNFNAADMDSTAQLLKEIGGVFDRGNRQLFLKAMLALQDGVYPWFEDNKRLLGNPDTPLFVAVSANAPLMPHVKLTSQTTSLWDKFSHLITDMEHPEQQLQCLDRFFCASFASCHRVIVNSAISLWNRLFENVEHLDYPEELKSALVQLQLHADIVLPGLESLSVEHAGQQPSFIDSFEDFSLPRLPSTRSSSRRGTPGPASAQSKSSPSLKPSRRQPERSAQRMPAATNRRNPPPRLRHEDSQVQFEAIEPSSALDSPMESQVLTERQKEVRDRQRENAGLFDEIGSSPVVSSKEADGQMLPVGPRTRQVTTPEPDRAFDDYVSSTPTPRRGQPMVVPEHDMTDPPSSPPELRGNPLAAEIRSRSASHSLLEEWQFSSSPVSGSPNPNRHGVISDPSSQRGYISIVSLPEVGDEVPSSPVKDEDTTGLPLVADDVIEDSMIFEPAKVAPAPERSATAVEEAPRTPRRSVRLSQTRPQETTPSKSDGEEFVDAPTSPLPPTPKQAEKATKAIEMSDARQPSAILAENSSFDMSELDESSLLRLVVELDAGKANRSEYHRSSPSLSPGSQGQRSPAIDCIVVGDVDSPEKPELLAPLRITRSRSAASAMSTAAEPQNIPSSQPTTRGRQKRKRGTSQVQEASPKRPRHDPVDQGEEVPDSQTAPVQEADVEIHGSEEMPAMRPEDAQAGGVHEERIPSSSVELSDSGSASQEGASQDSALAPCEAGDMMDVEEDDQDVQSQIALEFSHSQRHDADSTPASSDASSELLSPLVDIPPPITNEEEEDKITDTAESVTKAEEEEAPEPSRVQKIMELFRGGLGELRSAQLSREEVYRIEDIFMDMKRELYEAERRGRA
jgi:hypothetical protein